MKSIVKMALLRLLQPRNSLPDPRGSLSSSIPSQAITAANREVEEAIRTAASGKRGPYGQYSLINCLGWNWQVCLPSWCNCADSCLPDFMINMVATNTPVSSILLHFSACVKFKSLQKAHSAKILVHEIFSCKPFITQKFPDIQYPYCFCVCWKVVVNHSRKF